jgi:hypothetical protein
MMEINWGAKRSIKEWQEDINKWAEEKGWNRDLDGSVFCIGTQLTNMHSKISEAWEEIKDGNGFNVYLEGVEDKFEVHPLDHISYWAKHNCKPKGFPIELADLAIRLLHTCEFYDIDLEEMIRVKMAYNETRSFRHGNKKA